MSDVNDVSFYMYEKELVQPYVDRVVEAMNKMESLDDAQSYIKHTTGLPNLKGYKFLYSTPRTKGDENKTEKCLTDC